MAKVMACKAKDDYHLWLRFGDGHEGTVYLGNLLEIHTYTAWQDVREFEKVTPHPETDTVTWDCGIEIDADIFL